MQTESIIWYSKSKNAIPLNSRLRSKHKNSLFNVRNLFNYIEEYKK